MLLTAVRTIGVVGNAPTYDHVCALRAARPPTT